MNFARNSLYKDLHIGSNWKKMFEKSKGRKGLSHGALHVQCAKQCQFHWLLGEVVPSHGPATFVLVLVGVF